MAEVKLRVGVSVDASMKTAFRPLIQAAQDARRQILKEFSQVPKEIQAAFAGLGRAQGSTFRGATVEAQRANRELVAAARTAAREQLQIERDLERQRVLAVRTANREMLKEHREAARQEQALAREAASNARRSERELDRFATRTSHRATRFLAPAMPVVSIARRAAGEVVRGFGLDPTISGSFQRNIDLETSAVNLTNQARLNGQDVSSGSVQGAVRGIQKKYGTDQGETSGALEQYQKLTGDLGGGLGMLDELAKRSVTTGARLNDLAAAAGNISNNLGDVPNKAEAVLKVLDTMTVQGATGAVEISDMATQTAKLAAAAGLFGGNAGDNIAKMTALAEIARASGGAASAVQAATAIGSFTNTLDKPARVKAFKNANISLKDANNQFRDPFEIIKDIVKYTHGDTEKMGAFVQDAAAKRVVRGLGTAYNKAGGGTAGEAAMDAMFAKFMKGGISEQTRAANLKAHNESTEAQVKKLQAELDEAGRAIQAQLLPPLREAAPHLVKFVQAMGDAAKWALENPWKAAAATLAAVIARAGIESVLRKGIEDAIRAAAGQLGMRGAAGGVAGGAALTAATVAAVAGTGLAVSQGGKLAKTMGPTGAHALGRDLKALLPGFDKEGKFDSTHLIDSAFGMMGAAVNPLSMVKKLRGLGQGVMNVGRDLSFGRVDENLNLEAQGEAKKRAQEEAQRLGNDPASFGLTTKERWQAKPGVSDKDFFAAAKSGDHAQMEKLGNLISKTDNAAQKQLEGTTQLTKAIETLDTTIKTWKPSGGDNTPSINTDTNAYAYG